MSEFKIGTSLKDNYETFYEGGDSKWRTLGANSKSNNILSLCSQLPHSSILEIGAGDGSILKRLEHLTFGEKYYALEISRSGIETIKSKGIVGLVECKLFDGYHVPYEDNQFDLVILSHIIEHVEYPRKLLYEASRVAKNIFIEVPLEDNRRLKKDYLLDKVGHINFYNPRTIRYLIQSSHLQVLNQSTTNFSKAVYTHQYGFKGALFHLIKNIFLKISPSLATNLFTFNGALICHQTLDK